MSFTVQRTFLCFVSTVLHLFQSAVSCISLQLPFITLIRVPAVRAADMAAADDYMEPWAGMCVSVMCRTH